MKIAIYTLLILVFAACTKDSSQTSLQGTWELRSSFGGFTGFREYEPGNGNTIRFSGNRYTYRIVSPDTAYEFGGSFKVHYGRACENAPEKTLLTYDGSIHSSEIDINNNELSIAAPSACIADGETAIYARITP